LAAYEAYRTRLKVDPGGAANFRLAREQRFILSEERTFLRLVQGATASSARAPARCAARAKMLEFRDRGDEPLDILGTRQAVVAVLHQREHHIVAGKARGQLDRVLPRHIGILHPLENAHRTAGLDHVVEQEMGAALL